jgi:predicted Zn-dependent protease
LQNLNYEQQQYPVYFALLARTYGKLNNTTESHRYLAEYYYSVGNTRAALTQIKLAQKADDLNFYLSAILDQRLQFFYEEERLRQSGR